MNHRLQSSYEFVLKVLLKLRPKLSPTSIAVDFEMAEFSAFKKVFPKIQIRACFFHLQKSIVRKVYEKGHKVLYDTNSSFRRQVNMVPALAFVPTAEVGDAFSELRESTESSEFEKQLDPLLDYFEKSYVGQLISAQKRKKPRFDTKAWNIRVLIETGEPTTSNGIESFNGQMIRTMAASHPTIWKLIEGLRKEFALSQQRVAAYYAGENTPRRGIAYRHANERIKKVVGRYYEIPTKVDFLKAIAINLGSVTINSSNLLQVLADECDLDCRGKNEAKKSKKSFDLLDVISLNDENVSFDASFDEIGASRFQMTIGQRDIKRLQPKEWLNDKIVDYYLKLIMERSNENSELPRAYAFDSLFYTQLVEKGSMVMLDQSVWRTVHLFRYDILLVPIHTIDHWSLVVVDMIKQKILYYDSLRVDGTKHLNLLKEFLKKFSERTGISGLESLTWSGLCMKELPRQLNSDDCGVFMCVFAERASRNGSMEFEAKEMDAFRKKITEEILAGKLSFT